MSDENVALTKVAEQEITKLEALIVRDELCKLYNNLDSYALACKSFRDKIKQLKEGKYTVMIESSGLHRENVSKGSILYGEEE